jgi:CheY-like chemotaxis protein
LSAWMVVEDEPGIYELLLAMFEMWGIEGVAFVDGEEAVAWINDVDSGRVKGEMPELAILDIRLPGSIGGPEVGERIRKSGLLGDIPIVLITAYKLTIEEEAAVIQQAGADRLIYKPLPRFNDLKQILEDVIKTRRTRAKEPVVPPGDSHA